MKKTILLIMLVLSALLEAKMVNGIAMIVEGEPITTAEINAAQHQYHLSKTEATDMLIQDRLQKIAMKDIVIPEEEIDRKINEIAAKNGVTIPQMQQILEDQGTAWSQYRDSVRQALKKEKFFKENVIAAIPTPGEDELKLFYQHHKKNFVIPSTIKTKEYSSTSKEAMQRFLQTHSTKGIKVRTLTQKSKKINPALLSVLLSTPVGSLTRPFNTGERYILYKVLGKSGKVQLPYSVARNAVEAQWRKAQEAKALKDYFEKLRTRADIQIVR
ncbi:MAG: peptidyl-prolyl cis-trans isomerase [Sulfurovum sp.]|nr:MAG: peptidyl-prolyl cis-trans isomerase [Sulfurovum sp.]